MVTEIAIGVCVTTAGAVAAWAAKPLKKLLGERWQATRLSIYEFRGAIHIGATDREDVQRANGEYAIANSFPNRLRRLVSRQSGAKKKIRTVRCVDQ